MRRKWAIAAGLSETLEYPERFGVLGLALPLKYALLAPFQQKGFCQCQR